MGILRFLLAIAVVIAHCHSSFFGFEMVGGRLAVQSFFIISGFYMALILTTKYTGGNTYWLFLTSRLMRIYPLYWVMLIIIVLLSLSTLILNGQGGRLNWFIDYFHFFSIPSFVYAILVNIFIIGLDSLYYLGINKETGNFYFITNWKDNNPKVSNLTFNGPTWTISLELLFYMLAPFVNRLKLVPLFFFACISIAVKVFIHSKGLNSFPWGHAFFPAEFFLFIAGIIAYRIYSHFLAKKTEFPKRNYWLIFSVLILFTLFYPFFQDAISVFNWIYLFAFFLAVPFVFKLTKNYKLDYHIGEYSYPIYIVHIFLIFLGRKFFAKSGLPEIAFTPLMIILILLFSFVLIKFVVKPLEKRRQERIKKFIIPAT